MGKTDYQYSWFDYLHQGYYNHFNTVKMSLGCQTRSNHVKYFTHDHNFPYININISLETYEDTPQMEF